MFPIKNVTNDPYLPTKAVWPAVAELVCLQDCGSVSAVDMQQQDWAATSLNSAAARRLKGPGASLLPAKLIVQLPYK